ncbi:MAG: hypothetical protein ACK5II_10770 [Paracoccus sp. (in: a-proteobacteria)]
MKFALICLLLLIPHSAHAGDEEAAALCEWATQTAAAESGVPPDILGALTLTETGRRRDGVVRPWAWSVNAGGKGTWFNDPAPAIAFAKDQITRGQTNIDIGCFQLNYRWHGNNFSSVSEMFDPLLNARYAARFISQLHAEKEDWRTAAGAFHSRTPQYATRYLARFDEFRAALRSDGSAGMPKTAETYNRFAPTAVTGTSQRVRVTERRMLLGALPGTPPTGMPGSLATISDQRIALLSRGHSLLNNDSVPLIGPVTGSSILRNRQNRIRETKREPANITTIGEDTLTALSAVPDTGYLAVIPDGNPPPDILHVSGAQGL